MDIELRLLRSFAAIHETGSVSRAAERMGCTQAAMSMRLKMLETQIGAALVLRRPGGLVPTPRGAEVYARALAVLSAHDELVSLTRSRPARHRLRLGMPDDYASGWLAGLIGALGEGLDRIEIDLSCDLSARLVAAVERRDLDLALVTTAARPQRTVATAERPLLWLAAPGRVPGAETVLAAYPEGCVFRQAMTRALEAAGQPWRVAVQAQAQAGIFAAVRSGRAVTAVAAGTAPEGLVALAQAPGLPALPPVALHLVLGEEAPAPARRAAEALASLLEAVAVP